MKEETKDKIAAKVYQKYQQSKSKASAKAVRSLEKDIQKEKNERKKILRRIIECAVGFLFVTIISQYVFLGGLVNDDNYIMYVILTTACYLSCAYVAFDSWNKWKAMKEKTDEKEAEKEAIEEVIASKKKK